jgi:hypothetical protein
MHRSLFPCRSGWPFGRLLALPCLGLVLTPVLSGQTLTDAEADGIVADEVAAFEASRPVKPEFTISETVDQSNGDSGIIFHKVLRRF